MVNKDESKWIYTTTFGGKAKEFKWRIDDKYNIYILRTFYFKNEVKEVEKIITSKELDEINNYVSKDKEINLANNVEKLKNGQEKEGLGKFLYENLEWSIREAQLASQLVVIFSLSNVWNYNGLKRNIQIKKNSDDWIKLITAYYENTMINDKHKVVQDGKSMDDEEVKASDRIKVGKIYRHYKGKEYLVLHIAKHSETLEDMVVYQALYGENDIWVRPLEMFKEQVEVDGKSINRFEQK